MEMESSESTPLFAGNNEEEHKKSRVLFTTLFVFTFGVLAFTASRDEKKFLRGTSSNDEINFAAPKKSESTSKNMAMFKRTHLSIDAIKGGLNIL